MDDRTLNATLRGTLEASDGLLVPDRLMILEAAWLLLACQERTDAAVRSGGFSEAQARQLAQLDKLREFVQHDTPDPEAERLYQAGDIAGMVAHLERVIAQADGTLGGGRRFVR